MKQTPVLFHQNSTGFANLMSGSPSPCEGRLQAGHTKNKSHMHIPSIPHMNSNTTSEQRKACGNWHHCCQLVHFAASAALRERGFWFCVPGIWANEGRAMLRQGVVGLIFSNSQKTEMTILFYSKSARACLEMFKIHLLIRFLG